MAVAAPAAGGLARENGRAAYVNAVVRLIGETTSDFAEAAILTALGAAVEAALQAIVEITFTECRFNKRMLAGSLTSRARGATVEAARGLDCAALSHSRLAALVDSGTPCAGASARNRDQQLVFRVARGNCRAA
jgi:hypothetical protein